MCSIYEEDPSKNESLLMFSKLDYNLVQLLYKQELLDLSRWWKDLDLMAKLPYARDRLVEAFFWSIGVYYEPRYARARAMLTKTITMMSLIDDTFDSYGTIEELDIFTNAIQRWDMGEVDRIPEYMRPLYKAHLEMYEQFEEEIKAEGRSYAIYYSVESLKELVKSYHIEAKWFIQGHLPPFADYLDNALITCTHYHFSIKSLLGITSATKEEAEFLFEKPKILVDSSIICRLSDDIASYETEKQRGQLATGIECYMKDNGVTKEEAVNKLVEMIRNSWKGTNDEWFHPGPRDAFKRILNLERVIEVVYKSEDGFTKPRKAMKLHITQIVVDPIKNNSLDIF